MLIIFISFSPSPSIHFPPFLFARLIDNPLPLPFTSPLHGSDEDEHRSKHSVTGEQ
jgi:hypothetical protein